MTPQCAIAPALVLNSIDRCILGAPQGKGYQRRPQPPRHLLPQPPLQLLPHPPPRNSRTIRRSKIAPMVALTIALSTPVPRGIPIDGDNQLPIIVPKIPPT